MQFGPRQIQAQRQQSFWRGKRKRSSRAPGWPRRESGIGGRGHAGADKQKEVAVLVPRALSLGTDWAGGAVGGGYLPGQLSSFVSGHSLRVRVVVQPARQVVFGYFFSHQPTILLIMTYQLNRSKRVMVSL